MNGACRPTPDCPFYGQCWEDTHHEYWPRNAYQTKVERVFRALHTVELCRAQHEELHATSRPPRKPDRDAMVKDILSSNAHIPRSLKRELEERRL